jgi:hypothetical protein
LKQAQDGVFFKSDHSGTNAEAVVAPEQLYLHLKGQQSVERWEFGNCPRAGFS